MEVSARIEIMFRNEKDAEVAYKALFPETLSRLSDRSTTKVTLEGRILRLDFEAKDVTAMRAAINSYLRMLYAIVSTAGVLESVARE